MQSDPYCRVCSLLMAMPDEELVLGDILGRVEGDGALLVAAAVADQDADRVDIREG